MNINEISTKFLCSGCGTCSAVCNKHAITMRNSNMGRLYASVDEAKCVDCGLCIKVCPKTNVFEEIKDTSIEKISGKYLNSYIGRSNDDEIYKNAQSGGVVTVLLQYLFSKNMIDAAVVCVMEYGMGSPVVKYEIITDASSLKKSQKSCYTQVDMVSSALMLSEYRSVAVVGIPCHIQGFTNLQKIKKYQNIKYKIGLICDRSESGLFAEALMGNSFQDEKIKIAYRLKRAEIKGKVFSYKNAPIVISTENGKSVTIPNLKRFVLKDYFTLPSCRVCYDKLNVNADIVCGDPWGIDGKYDKENGDSLFIVRTPLMQNIVDDMLTTNLISAHRITMDEIIKGQRIQNRVDDLNNCDWQYIYAQWQQKENCSKKSLLRKANFLYKIAKYKMVIKNILKGSFKI